jgi:mono/diheme cytochrome c family protein
MRPFAILLLLASPAFAEPTPRERGDLVLRARSILKRHCAECHKPGGESFDILDHAALTGQHPVPFAKKGGRSQIIEFLEDGSMPPAGKPRPAPEDIAILKEWIAAETPAFPRAFDDAMVATAVEGDWRKRKPAENYRYVSFANLVNGDAGLVELREQESKLRAAILTATSAKRQVELEPVDSAGVVYRLNVNALGWTAPDCFEEINVNGAAGAAAEFLAVDLIQLEYPFPSIDAARFAKLLPKSRFAPAVAILRGDWLTEALGSGSPLAADLRAMAELAEAKPNEEVLGPKLPTTAIAAPSAKGIDPPLTSWYSNVRSGPLDLQFGVKDQKPPYAVRENGSFTLEALAVDRTARAVLFNVLADGTVRLHTRMDVVLKKGEPYPFPIKLAAYGGIADPREFFILFASDTELPKFTIVRSTHFQDFTKKDRAPIWRVVVDHTAKQDSARTSSRTIEVRVTKK